MTDPSLTGQAVGAHERGALDRPASNQSETRPGFKTTEMVLTVVAAVAAIVAAYASGSGYGSFPIRWGWLLAIIVVSAYVLSRGIAKAGVADRFDPADRERPYK